MKKHVFSSEAARRLVEQDNVTWLLMSPQLILPGSPDYKALLTRPKMYKKYAGQDLIDIVEINQDFLMYFTPDLTREEIIEEIKKTFDDIKREYKREYGEKEGREKLVLDVKGVSQSEEEFISPNRPYVDK